MSKQISPRLIRAVALGLAFIAPMSETIAQTSVKPLSDAARTFPEIRDLIARAESFVHIAVWVFDDEIRLSAASQHSVTPLLSRKSQYTIPAGVTPGSVEAIDCPTPVDSESAIAILRCKAVSLAQRREQGHAPLSIEWEEARGEVAVVVWNDPLDDSYQPPATNLDDLGYILLSVGDLWQWKDDVTLHNEMRKRGSGESVKVLHRFREVYTKYYPATSNAMVPMPSGIMVMQQKNNNTPVSSSHHQKLVVTDTGAYVGGDNFTKEFWDIDNHLLTGRNPERWASLLPGLIRPSLPAYDSDGGPLHDTGAIIRGDAVAILNDIFLARWSTNINNNFGVAVRKSTAALKLPLKLSTPFEPLRVALETRFTRKRPAAERDLDKYVEGLESQSWAANPTQGAPNSVADVMYIASNVDVTVSKPKDSYADKVRRLSTRGVYNTTISQWMGESGSFAYFESQFAGDHNFFFNLFQVCVPRDPITPTWCHRDPLGFFVVPYEPRTIPSTLIAPLLVGDITHDEMQNFIWMEVKTANGIRDRTTSRDILAFAIPPEPCPPCPYSDLTSGYPYIRFQDHNLETDPSLVTIDSIIEMRGSDPTAGGSVVNCGTPTLPRFEFCPNGPVMMTKQVREIIADSAFMSYTLANTDNAAPTFAPGSQFDNYHNSLLQFGVYLHSKHSEFFGISGTGRRDTFVIGSSNINTRSLGSTGKQKDAEDSELDTFWTPADRQFNGTIWTEHLGFTASYPNEVQNWEDQGWTNWMNLRNRQVNVPKGRVVRLDSVERCIRFGGC